MVIRTIKKPSKWIPVRAHIGALIASKEGGRVFKSNISSVNYTLLVGLIDEKLTVHAYIVPELGNVGDLTYGEKL